MTVEAFLTTLETWEEAHPEGRYEARCWAMLLLGIVGFPSATNDLEARLRHLIRGEGIVERFLVEALMNSVGHRLEDRFENYGKGREVARSIGFPGREPTLEDMRECKKQLDTWTELIRMQLQDP